MKQKPTYLSHVSIAIFFRYPLGHLGSPSYPDCPVVGVNPSFARRRRKAETERQDAQQASSPNGVVDHLPPLLTRLFASSSASSADQANNQTSLRAEQDCHRNTNILAKTPTGRKRGREGGVLELRRGKIHLILKPLLSTWESWKFVCPLAVPLSLYFPQQRRERARLCRACFARESVNACARAEPLKADFASPRTTRMLVVQLIGLSCGEMATAPPHK